MTTHMRVYTHAPLHHMTLGRLLWRTPHHSSFPEFPPSPTPSTHTSDRLEEQASLPRHRVDNRDPALRAPYPSGDFPEVKSTSSQKLILAPTVGSLVPQNKTELPVTHTQPCLLRNLLPGCGGWRMRGTGAREGCVCVCVHVCACVCMCVFVIGFPVTHSSLLAVSLLKTELSVSSENRLPNQQSSLGSCLQQPKACLDSFFFLREEKNRELHENRK
jgi:hypothetical protein